MDSKEAILGFSALNLENLLEELPEALFLVERDGTILDVNKEACRLLGYEEGELLDMDFPDLIADGKDLPLPDLIRNTRESTERSESTFVHKNGTGLGVNLKIKTLNSDTRPVRILISARATAQREEVLRKSQVIAEGSSQAIYLFQDNEFKFVNESFQELSGYTKEELLNGSFLELLHPKDQEKIVQWTRQALRGDDSKLPETVEYRVLPKKGEAIWVRSNPSLTEYKGKPAIVGNAVEVTEERKTSNKLRQYKMAVEGSDDLMAACDENYRYLFANAAYREFHGRNEQEILDMNLKKVLGAQEFEEQVKPRVDRCLEGHSVEYEMRRTHSDLGERFLQIAYYPLEDHGEIQGVVSVMRDITDRKKAERKLRKREEKFRGYIENAPNGVFVLDKAANFEEVNGAACEMTGYSEEELLSRGMEVLFPPESKEQFKEALHQLVSEGEVRVDLPFVRKNGNRGQLLAHAVELAEERFLLFANDITEHKEVEEALGEQRRKLKHLHNAVNKLQKQNTEVELARTAVDVADNMLDFDLCVVDMLEGNRLVPKANSSRLEPEMTQEFEIGEGISGKTIQKGETIWGKDLKNYPEAKPTDEDFKSFISVPIGEMGIFQVISKKRANFDQEDVDLAEILASHLREELKRLRFEEDLKDQAVRDPLTGLYNRRYLDETLENEIERCRRYNRSLGFLMMDVNRFKEINDRYSHQTGDKVLKEVSELLQNNVRSADIIVRYGGDEFLILLPETNGEVQTTAERLRSKLASWNQDSEILDFPLTFAMGLAHWSPNQDRDIEEALKKADRRMYEEKKR